MKKLLSKMFFVSDCAKGMLFALTLCVIGNYLWVSLFLMFLLWNGEKSWVLRLLKDDGFLWIAVVGILAYTLYGHWEFLKGA